MSALGTRRLLFVGAALIVLTNAVVLGGAYYNRSGEPDAVFRLTERELRGANEQWSMRNENSGLSLKLQWRLARRADVGPGYDFGFSGYGGEVAWLDAEKLKELGFAAPQPARAIRARWYEKQLPRSAFLVMEFDGAAYQAALKRAEDLLARDQAAAAAHPDDRQASLALKMATENLERERNRSSRIFLVDAGRDADALRAKYPDRARFAIVRGKISVGMGAGGKPIGLVQTIDVAEVHVPLSLRAQIEQSAAFDAELAFGRRLEPWLRAASRRNPIAAPASARRL